MRGFVGANPGLPERFPKTIHFPDYTTRSSSPSSGRCVSRARTSRPKRHSPRYSPTSPRSRTKGFGNGRLAETYHFEAAISPRQATRLMAPPATGARPRVLPLPTPAPAPPRPQRREAPSPSVRRHPSGVLLRPPPPRFQAAPATPTSPA